MADIETFDVYEMATGTTYPEETLVIYLDGAKAKELSELESKANLASKSDVDALDKKVASLKETLKKSRLEIVMRGLPASQRKAIDNELGAQFGVDDDEVRKTEEFSRRENALYALASIQKITNYEGKEASVSSWDADKMDQWLLMLPDYYRVKIIKTMAKLTFDSQYYEQIEISTDF